MNIKFPSFTGLRVRMMPFIQGRPETLPKHIRDSAYNSILKECYLKKDQLGFLTIDESYVKANETQRGQNKTLNVHTEACLRENNLQWGVGWGQNSSTILEESLEGLIANSITNTCGYWNKLIEPTKDGNIKEDYTQWEFPNLLTAGEVKKISIFTPHACLPQKRSGPRQFLRIMGSGIIGKDPTFDFNPVINY